MIRICLIVALVAGLGATALNFAVLRTQINTIIEARNKNAEERDAERTAKETAQKNLRTTTAELNTTKTNLATAESNLRAATARATEQETRARELASNLDRTKTELNTSQQELSQWRLLNMSIDQARALQGELRKSREERDVITAENRVMVKKIRTLENQLARYEGDNRPPQLPAGLKGRIVAVDPKYDFVVLDIGGNHGVLERGEMLVARNGKMIGKVQITSVEPTRSFANVVPGFKQADVQEGDQVLY
jgi:hypothetical protein